MKTIIPTYEISIPEYVPNTKPNYKTIGKKLDTLIKKHFLGKTVCIRAVGSQDHTFSHDEVIQRIKNTGTDRYDTTKKSFWENDKVYLKKGIDMFACLQEITKDFHFMHEVIKDFYESAPGDRGFTVHVNILLLYDASKLKMIPIKYAKDDIGEDAWKFNDSKRKKEALLGIIKIK
ncbi:hypothetical protein CL622_02695 [archaeon]|nr:hypothetical protein [archaeon]|tara:strand:+ start:2497 stop:3024 length:528 start_codon:yes stop_codon:yes gene_type:complete